MGDYDYLKDFTDQHTGTPYYDGQLKAGIFEADKGWPPAPQWSIETHHDYLTRVNSYNDAKKK